MYFNRIINDNKVSIVLNNELTFRSELMML